MGHASADSEVSILRVGKDHMRCVGAGGQSAPRGPDRGFACWHAARRAGPLRCRSGTPPPPLWTADCRLGTPKPVPERQNAFRDASCPRTGFGHSGTPGGRPGHASTRSRPPCVPARPKPVPERQPSRCKVRTWLLLSLAHSPSRRVRLCGATPPHVWLEFRSFTPPCVS